MNQYDNNNSIWLDFQNKIREHLGEAEFRAKASALSWYPIGQQEFEHYLFP
jgi:hypothetical protein